MADQLPPQSIKPYTSTTVFSVSGIENSAEAPKGKVCYDNLDKNLKVIFEWHASGWAFRFDSTAAIIITGIKPAGMNLLKAPAACTLEPVCLEGDANAKLWIFTLKSKESKVSEVDETSKSTKFANLYPQLPN